MNNLNDNLKDVMARANAVIDTVSVHDMIIAWSEPDTIFVDVRETVERQESGTIPGATHAPRAFLEFMADPEGPMHLSDLTRGKKLVLFCATGGRSVLAAKTLRDFGIGHVFHMGGGFRAWCEAGGLVEDVC